MLVTLERKAQVLRSNVFYLSSQLSGIETGLHYLTMLKIPQFLSN